MSPHLRSSIPWLPAPPTAVSCTCARPASCAAAHAAPPSRLTHRQFGRSSGRVCNQWWCNSRKATQVELQQLLVLVVQLQQTETADCRLQGDCCMLVPAASISRASSYGCLCLPRDIPVSTRICCQNSIFSTEQSAKSAKGELKNPKYASWTT